MKPSTIDSTIGSVGGIAFLGSESPEAGPTLEPSMPLRHPFFRPGAALQHSSAYVGSSMLHIYTGFEVERGREVGRCTTTRVFNATRSW